MSYVTHEIMIRDQGQAKERATLRSSVTSPAAENSYDMAEIQYQESALPGSVSDLLKDMLNMHEDALASKIGMQWIGRNSDETK